MTIAPSLKVGQQMYTLYLGFSPNDNWELPLLIFPVTYKKHISLSCFNEYLFTPGDHFYAGRHRCDHTT
jgi:hypothetical protein